MFTLGYPLFGRVYLDLFMIFQKFQKGLDFVGTCVSDIEALILKQWVSRYMKSTANS